VFLDRDGTINQSPAEGGYVTRVEDFHVLPGAAEGMAKLAGCGYALVVVSNQRGVAKGLTSEDVLRATEEVVHDALRAREAEVAGFYYCPHELDEGCDCRKPAPGMLLRAAADLDLDLGSSWMVGDSQSDVEAGAAAGCKTAFLGTQQDTAATIAADSLADAADVICGHT
jgi:D-glycero-D-manno-heptose 1,7-bisphosphate phosphatase